MAHFAKLDNENKVIEVIVISNQVMLDENGQEQESLGVAFLKQLFGEDFKFVQCSYSKSFRWFFPGVNSIYLPEYDAFIQEKPFPSYVIDGEKRKWVPPIPYPADILDGKKYRWDEETISWVKINE